MHRLAPAAILAAVLLTACSGAKQRPPVVAPTATPSPLAPIVVGRTDPIVIGVSVALTGDQAALGRDIADAAALAAAEFGPSLRGHAIDVRPLDDGCSDPERAADVARRLVATGGLAGVIGPMCTTGVQAAGTVYERAGFVHISPSVTRIDASTQGERLFFRTAWRDDAQAAVQARYVRDEARAGRVVVIDDGEPYGKGLADAFVEAFDPEGSRTSRERVKRGTTDFTTRAISIEAGAPDAVVYEGLNPEGVLILQALREAGYAGAFVGGDGVLSARDFVQPDPAAAEGAVLTGGPAPDAAFTLRFAARTGRVPGTPFVLQSYDGVMALLRALDSVATERADGALEIDREALASRLRGTRTDGLTGPIVFDERGDRRGETTAELGLAIYRVVGGALERIGD